MNKNIIRFILLIFLLVAVGYPLWVGISANNWANNNNFLRNIFPLFGLLAVSLLWIHSLCGVFEEWLKKYINFDLFINITATIILLSIILHPLLLFAIVRFDLNRIATIFSRNFFIWLAAFALLLLLTYDAGKLLKKIGYKFFDTHWNNILIISNIGFLLIFFHSLVVGGDLQEGSLRNVWIFYGVTATLAIIYTYIIKPLLKTKD